MFSKSSLQSVKKMRTIGQHNSEDAMTHMKKLFLRPTSTIVEDAAGVAVLFLLLFAGLTLSGAA
jgi:hypothetical protein